MQTKNTISESNALLDTTGLKSAVCDVNNIKKGRYAIQVIKAIQAIIKENI